jgi:putative toxin-antitoxin system antitoxin component (TIGR02293 family)
MATAGLSLLDSTGQWLGVHVESEQQLAALAEKGLPTEVVRVMQDRGLSPSEVYALVIPQRTLEQRRSWRETLNRDESERAIRMARVLAFAQRVLGSEEKAFRWLREPKRRFEGRTPLPMCVTGSGAQLVEEMLIQIDEGMFA